MNAVIAEPAARRRSASACLYLEAPARPEEAGRLRRAVTDFLTTHVWPANDVDEIALAVGEACNNAVSYSPLDALVSLHAQISATGDFYIEIRNPGDGFAPDISQLTALPDDFAVHGRGFALMSALMDDVQVSREDGDTVVRLSKRRLS